MNINVIITQQFFQVHQYFLRLKGGPQQYKPPLMGHTLVIYCWGGNLEYRNKQNRLHTWIILFHTTIDKNERLSVCNFLSRNCRCARTLFFLK